MIDPADAGIRETIRTEHRRNVIVEASAGTGKTTLLIDRVLHLIDSGIDLDRIGLVTFTEAAASELRLRLREKLETLTGKKLKKALMMLPEAWIHTIHAFSSRILREYSHLTGVDPDFSVCASRFTPLEMAVRWDRFITGLRPSDLTESGRLIRLSGTGGLLALATEIWKHPWIRNEEPFGSCRGILKEFPDKAVPVLGRLLPLCTDSSDKLYINISSAIEYLNSLASVPPRLQPRKNLPSANCGSQAVWKDSGTLKQVQDMLRSIRNEYAEALFPIIACIDIEEQIGRLVIPFVTKLRNEWNSDRSRFSYEDLLYNSWSAMESGSDLRAILKGKFDHILIDEFQDTSRVQTGIFRSFLATGGDILPGRLTIVGDRKQSIYGWRNADIETYSSTVRDLKKSDALSRTITVNFRSTKNIIRFVNAVGKELFEQQTPEEAPFGCSYSPIEPAPEAPEGPAVEIIDMPDRPDELKLSLNAPAWAARCQAEHIVGRIRREMNGGNCSWGDFALMIGKNTHLPQFVTVFEREEIPYTVCASRDFRNLTDTADLREILRCLVSPDDRMAWIHTLRSGFFGMDDISITRALAEGTTGYLSESDSCQKEIADINHMLRRLRKSARELPLRDFLPVLLFETDLLSVITAVGFQVNRRLSGIQYILETVFSGETETLKYLLVMMDTRLAPSAIAEPVSLPENGDALVVTTIHRAKGLAFRHVFLAGLSSKRKGVEKHDLIADAGKARAGFSFSKNAVTAHWPALKAGETARRNAETRRLLYVAITRARLSLTVFLTQPGNTISPAKITADAVTAAVENDPDCCIRRELEPLSLSQSSETAPVLPPAPHVSRQAETPFFSIRIQPPESRELLLGTAVHAILEKIDFRSPSDWIQKHGERIHRSMPLFFEEAADLAMELFNTELPIDIGSCSEIGREYAYLVSTPTGHKTRYIDLLLDAGDRLIVLDYKTDHVKSGNIAAVAEQYLPVQTHYGKDMAEAFGREVSCYIAFLRERTCFHVGDFSPTER